MNRTIVWFRRDLRVTDPVNVLPSPPRRRETKPLDSDSGLRQISLLSDFDQS